MLFHATQSVFSDDSNTLSRLYFVTYHQLLHCVYKCCYAHQRTFTKTNEELGILRRNNTVKQLNDTFHLQITFA